MSPLDTLIGATVVQVETVNDYLQLCFNGDRVLTVFNEIEVTGTLADFVHGLVRAHLVKAEMVESKLVLSFDNHTELTVRMSDDAYRGPEAIHLIRPGESLVVW